MTFTVAAWVGNKQGSMELFVSLNIATLPIAYSLFLVCVLSYRCINFSTIEYIHSYIHAYLHTYTYIYTYTHIHTYPLTYILTYNG